LLSACASEVTVDFEAHPPVMAKADKAIAMASGLDVICFWGFPRYGVTLES
jgi:hypothetical protein